MDTRDLHQCLEKAGLVLGDGETRKILEEFDRDRTGRSAMKIEPVRLWLAE